VYSHIDIDLAAPADRRWTLTDKQRVQARELLDVYIRDLGVDEAALRLLFEAAQGAVPMHYQVEMLGLAEILDVPAEHVFAGNLYYDALKVIWGCTAFALEGQDGPVHARNLDWGTQDRVLNNHTAVTHFRNAPAGEFVTVGWPGFVGVLSAVAHGRFAVTLNAVLSDDAAQTAIPVVFLLRKVLEEAPDFREAVRLLSVAPIASDCLLLVSGPKTSEMAVVERTPTRHAVRLAELGAVFVTNDYLALRGLERAGNSEPQQTACRRRERIQELVRASAPASLESCLEHLSDPDVRMLITVQQMAFHSRTGAYALRIP
jgi:predicted choloylglycine hydrolase